MSDGMRRELVYLSSHATNRYLIPNWGNLNMEMDGNFPMLSFDYCFDCY